MCVYIYMYKRFGKDTVERIFKDGDKKEEENGSWVGAHMVSTNS